MINYLTLKHLAFATVRLHLHFPTEAVQMKSRKFLLLSSLVLALTLLSVAARAACLGPTDPIPVGIPYWKIFVQILTSYLGM